MFFQTWFADRIWWINRFRSYSDVTDIWDSPVEKSRCTQDVVHICGFEERYLSSGTAPGHSLLGKIPEVTMTWSRRRSHKSRVFPCRKWVLEVVEVDEDLWQNRRNFNWKLEDLPLDLQPRNQKLLKLTAILPLPRCLSKLHSTQWSCGNWKLVGKPSPSFATLQSKWWKNTSFSLKLRCHIFSTSRGLKLEIPSKNSIQTLKQTIKPSNNFSALHLFRTAWLAAQKMPKYFWLGRCPRTRLGWLGHKETMGLASHSRISGVSPDDMQRPGWLIASEKKQPGWKVSSCRCQALMIQM